MVDRVRMLSEVIHERIVRKGMAKRTEESYRSWILRFVGFCGRQHPSNLGAADVERFLSHLAVVENVAPATQNQALAALLFLYRDVLLIDLPWLSGIERSKKPSRLPVVLSRKEVDSVLAELSGTSALVARLLYGSGLRLMEALRLRVKDVDFQMGQLTVRDGKGGKGRLTLLPTRVRPELANAIEACRVLHQMDLDAGFGEVWMPMAVGRKYPNAGREFGWQYVFPASRRSTDRDSGKHRRHHLDESAIQRAVKIAVLRAGIIKPASCHTLRHSFATH